MQTHRSRRWYSSWAIISVSDDLEPRSRNKKKRRYKTYLALAVLVSHGQLQDQLEVVEFLDFGRRPLDWSLRHCSV